MLNQTVFYSVSLIICCHYYYFALVQVWNSFIIAENNNRRDAEKCQKKTNYKYNETELITKIIIFYVNERYRFHGIRQ
jgi:hypothetical protein